MTSTDLTIFGPTDELDRAGFVHEIKRTGEISVMAAIRTGELLIAAKKALPGEFGAMVEQDLRWGLRYAQMFMAIAQDERLTDPNHGSRLPSSPRTLYEIHKLDDETFRRRIEDETINPSMQRKDVIGGQRSLMADRHIPSGLDFFPTPPWATRALFERVFHYLGIDPYEIGEAADPSCGEGHITGVLMEYADTVIGSDIHDYSANGLHPPGWISVYDYLAEWEETNPPIVADWFVMNPPFDDNAGIGFILNALKMTRRGVAVFVRQQFLETGERYEALFRDQPPTVYAQFVERVNLCEGRWDPDGSTATAYCWLVWDKKQAPQPMFWIPPGCRKALEREDDRERFTAQPVLPPASLPVVDQTASGEGAVAEVPDPEWPLPAWAERERQRALEEFESTSGVTQALLGARPDGGGDEPPASVPPAPPPSEPIPQSPMGAGEGSGPTAEPDEAEAVTPTESGPVEESAGEAEAAAAGAGGGSPPPSAPADKSKRGSEIELPDFLKRHGDV